MKSQRSLGFAEAFWRDGVSVDLQLVEHSVVIKNNDEGSQEFADIQTGHFVLDCIKVVVIVRHLAHIAPSSTGEFDRSIYSDVFGNESKQMHKRQVSSLNGLPRLESQPFHFFDHSALALDQRIQLM